MSDVTFTFSIEGDSEGYVTFECPFCGAELPQSENVIILENDGTYSVGNIYECDPEKNTECNKRGCFINGGECRHTTRVEYAKEDRE